MSDRQDLQNDVMTKTGRLKDSMARLQRVIIMATSLQSVQLLEYFSFLIQDRPKNKIYFQMDVIYLFNFCSLRFHIINSNCHYFLFRVIY